MAVSQKTMTAFLCNICDGLLIPRFPRVLDTNTDESFAVYRCVSCGLGHTIPQPDDLNQYYGENYYGGRHGFTASYCARRRLRIINSAIGTRSNRTLLDVGCGDGTLLTAARAAGWTVFGTEIYPTIARGANLDVRESIDQLDDCAPFDCITIWHGLEHLRDPHSTIIRLSGLLKPGGALVIAVPDSAGLQAKIFGPNWFHLDVPRHLHHFDSVSLARLMNSAGLTIERKWHQELEYDLLGWSQSALNLLFPVPNSFFFAMTGRHPNTGKFTAMASVALGLVLSVLALPVVVLGTVLRRGGTLVMLARRSHR